MASYTNKAWWSKDKKKQAGDLLVALVDSQTRQQSQRYLSFRRFISVYEYGYKASDRLTTQDRYLDDTVMTFNAAQNAVDTVVAQIATPRVVPMAITEGGSWGQRDRAEKLTQCLQGQFDELNFDEMKESVIRDAALCGLGALKIFHDESRGKIMAERVLPLDLLFDDAESRYGKPRCMYHTQVMDRFVAADLYGDVDDGLVGAAADRKQKILSAESPKPDESDTVRDANDSLIRIYEGWHLPSRAPDPTDPEDEGSGDGCHVIAINGCLLVHEPWTRPTFPFAFYIPKPSRMGMWGIPVMRQLASGQREFERATEKLQRAHQKMGGSHILVNKAAKLAKRSVTNTSGDVWEWEGQIPPTVFNPEPASAQAYQWIQSIPDQMLRFAGISPLSAQSQVPAGLQQASGKALQVFEDAENRRYIEWHRELERLVLSVGDLLITEARELMAAGSEVKVRYRDKKGFEKISWKDVLLDESEFTLRVYPVNLLAQTPSAKLAQADAWLNAKAITTEEWRELSGMPDLQAKNDLDQADKDIIQKNLDHMMRTGKYVQPEPFDKLQLILELAGKFYNLARLQDVGEKKLGLIRQLIQDTNTLLNAGQGQPASPDAGAPPMPPPEAGGPMPPPPGGAGPMPEMNGVPPTMPDMPAAA